MKNRLRRLWASPAASQTLPGCLGDASGGLLEPSRELPGGLQSLLQTIFSMVICSSLQKPPISKFDSISFFCSFIFLNFLVLSEQDLLSDANHKARSSKTVGGDVAAGVVTRDIYNDKHTFLMTR